MRKKIVSLVIVLFIFIILDFSGAAINGIDIKKDSSYTYLVPPYVRPGDIVFMEINNYYYKIPGWDHCGIYVGNNEFIHAGSYLNCVAKHNLAFFESLDIQIVYGKVITSNDTQRINAIDFAEGQIGKPYNSQDLKDQSFDSEDWYCSELVWAAYLSQGIDLDRNGWNFPYYVTTLEICWDDDVEMYTDSELNNWYPGFYLSWFLNYIINYPKNH